MSPPVPVVVRVLVVPATGEVQVEVVKLAGLRALRRDCRQSVRMYWELVVGAAACAARSTASWADMDSQTLASATRAAPAVAQRAQAGRREQRPRAYVFTLRRAGVQPRLAGVCEARVRHVHDAKWCCPRCTRRRSAVLRPPCHQRCAPARVTLNPSHSSERRPSQGSR